LLGGPPVGFRRKEVTIFDPRAKVW